jgi:peptidoglycan/xylan/chitin deacetylase (PgdA/CDA1 family)
MATWTDLEQELNDWASARRVPTFWWRDDDTEAPGATLDRLLALSRRHGVPLHLAVVPARLDRALARRLAGETDVFTLQHGFAHRNHEPEGHGASEIGDHRDLALQLDDLRRGWKRLEEAGLPNLLPAVAPPWNRISQKTVGQLAGLGYRMLSTSFPRRQARPATGLVQVNIHVDPIRWKDGPRFRGEQRVLEGIRRHLADRRNGTVDPEEPTGILTHHLQTDEETWAFVDTLFSRLTGRVRWARLADMLDAV